MQDWILLLPILVPAVAGLLVLAMRKSRLIEPIAFLVTLANLAAAIALYTRIGSGTVNEYTFSAIWAGNVGGINFDFALRLFGFSAFVLMAGAGFSFLVAVYSWKFMSQRPWRNQYYGYLLLTVAMVNGAVLADHLIVLLFFWEALLATLFGMIAIGRAGAWRTATKAFVITGITDLCLMAGIIMTIYLSGNRVLMSEIGQHPLDLSMAVGGITAPLAFIFLMIGAISKAGSMPFHSWIPDAAVDAPLPFMAFLPASLEKLLGIYLLARITLNLYHLTPESWLSTLMMIIGAATIILAVMMALVQKDYKKLLSFHAISQVGYMVLGVGTAIPIGIVGGLFHMINHAMYKSCLFLSGGSVELQAGTTDLSKIGGLGRKMPITFACFIIAAASISGCPPFNGFFSKELVYAGSFLRGEEAVHAGGSWVWYLFYASAIVGTFLTAASFLKLGHAAYLGKRNAEHDNVKEASPAMWLPMAVIAGFCVFFGFWNQIPLKNFIEPLVSKATGEEFTKAVGSAGTFGTAVEPWNWVFAHPVLPILAVVALLAALLNHIVGWQTHGRIPLRAVDHINHAPVLDFIYEKAEKRWFDPYELFLKLVRVVSYIGYAIDRINDFIYNGLAVGITQMLSFFIRILHTGSYAMYIVWCLLGAVAVIVFLVGSF